ncbi:aminoglycoside phosphotransferase family protein [Streptomyces sp. NPDC017868]|uniref:aminoglycoside phosphotransferase family protein n=1 Tax=Streptomyces sp. NPDC017868 TaxID=3365014 RepID=UPI003787439A
MWGDAVEIDESLVRDLLRDQHPDLAELPVREVPGGWDNRMWRLGEELAVRMPRTERAPELLRKEYRWLPALAPLLPLPVPVPVRAGEPSARFPRTWAVVRWVRGEPGDVTPVTRGDHAADALAGFLRALHREAPPEAPANPDRGVPLGEFAARTAGFEEGLALLAEHADPVAVRRTWEDALAAPGRQGPPLWLHGDLHPANVVVADGTLAGVVDFGEVCAGDPATDLSAAWLLLPEGAAARFFRTYARVDPATVRRARGWALLRAAGLIAIGRAGDRGLPGGKPTWGPAGRAALARVLGEPIPC